jgi:hypothetical protein
MRSRSEAEPGIAAAWVSASAQLSLHDVSPSQSLYRRRARKGEIAPDGRAQELARRDMSAAVLVHQLTHAFLLAPLSARRCLKMANHRMSL